jgi:hypothetical protein
MARAPSSETASTYHQAYPPGGTDIRSSLNVPGLPAEKASYDGGNNVFPGIRQTEAITGKEWKILS